MKAMVLTVKGLPIEGLFFGKGLLEMLVSVMVLAVSNSLFELFLRRVELLKTISFPFFHGLYGIGLP